MAQGHISLKRIGLDKTNSRIVVISAVGAFLTVFFLVASITLISQLMYQNRVISVKKKAVAQLQANIKASGSLVTSYKAFVSTPQNLLGGDPSGNGPQDGNNAKLVLDALPSQYDFPGLTSSLEKLMTDQHVKIQNIQGTDDEVAQSSATAAAGPVAIPFSAAVSGDYQSVQNVISAMDRSIRPIQIQSMEISGDQSNLTLSLNAQTFYQPETSVTITKKVVK